MQPHIIDHGGEPQGHGRRRQQLLGTIMRLRIRELVRLYAEFDIDDAPNIISPIAERHFRKDKAAERVRHRGGAA